jgi:two-component system chemotaxis response regulator CheY
VPISQDTPILVVDDSATMSMLIRSLLREIGLTNTAVVQDGAAALELLRGQRFALVIADWKMQPMSGLELLRRIRLDPATRSVRFLLITADAHPQLPATAGKLGADAFLLKPFTAEILRCAIEEALEPLPTELPISSR